MLRRIFTRWGLPDHVRVDNGYPWGTSRDLPSELALWLIGLAVEPIWNPPARPTRNAKVERSNGLTQQWGEIHTCADIRQAERALTKAARIQREEYPSCGGRSRLEAYPGLRVPRRRYRRAREEAAWDLSRVDVFLARGSWVRRVDCNGRISIYGHGRTVGRARAGQDVVLRFDAARRLWLVSEPDGTPLKELPAIELTRESIVTLSVSRRRPPRRTS